MKLSCENLNFNYENNHILKDVSLTIPNGKISVIIGPNGCGKSTLLKNLTRVYKNFSGRIIVDGKDILTINTKELAKKIALLPQTPDIQGGITVEELVAYGRFPYSKPFVGKTKEDLDIIYWAMEMTDVLHLKERLIHELSGGQKQRVWIAMALCQKTDMIFLDEPTTYLDMAHQLEILELLKSLNEKHSTTIVMVLHDINHASRFADNIIAMRDGNVINEGTPDTVITRDTLHKVYGIDAIISKDPLHHNPICVTYNILKKEI